MSPRQSLFRWKLQPREIRWLIYLSVVLVVGLWKFMPRPWHPTAVVETPHHKIYSTATSQQIQDTAHALELLYAAYSNRLGTVSGWQADHPKLQIKLYKDRDEMRRINPGLGWAEAFYRPPCCRAYFAADEINPYHWMLHESVHQLNHEVAHLKLEKWLDEGLADYFATSRITNDKLDVGNIDLNTYPVWWIDSLATSSNLTENIKNGSVIPLRAIITDHGGPSINDQFNLYYLHWWTLTHFLFESEKYHDRAVKLAQKGGGLADFETIIGPVDQVQTEWHDYVRRLKAALAGKDIKFFKSKKVPKPVKSADQPANAK
ncbi:MAG: DUF1570 domain-containing protein [Verrucomicrobiae bacterium]|nr:DUF1570 domain-containing protein [Verrucomicrobiae bacterium]